MSLVLGITELGWPAAIVSVSSVVLSLSASIHVLLGKRDTRAAFGWIGLIWLSPFLGVIFYGIFGINRIQRRAKHIRRRRPGRDEPFDPGGEHQTEAENILSESDFVDQTRFRQLANLVGELTDYPLLGGNRILPLVGGDQAYTRMVEAIDQAQHSIGLACYIFRDDQAGAMIIEALKRAIQRGVETRVLIDDLGARHGGHSAIPALRKADIPMARFIPTHAPSWFLYINLRNHRKILVIDGKVGFTGGMNIDESFLWSSLPKEPKLDLHFEAQGPAVAALRHAFAEDWSFTTGENLSGPKWFPEISKIDPSIDFGFACQSPLAASRGISDGPDEDLDKTLHVFLGALSVAKESVRIMTPYFLPEMPLIASLNVAAMRGVQVDIVIPYPTNSRLVQWACVGSLNLIIQHGCRVWLSPPPFDHAKVFTIDGAWSLIGSSNWDSRSLRLNFEFNMECYDMGLAYWLDQLIQDKIAASRQVNQDWLDQRHWSVKIRDAAARLLTPYL